MPTRNVTLTNSDMAVLYTWSGLLNTDDGQPVESPPYADRTVQVTGTFGVGGNARIEGSNNGTNWNTLNDPQGTPLNFTAGNIEVLLENPRFIRPIITAGDGTTNIAVTMYCRRSFR
jgi:hypothetical protein